MPDCIDMHMHVGLTGDRWPNWGGMSDWYQKQLTFKIFLLYTRLDAETVSDTVLRHAAEETIRASKLKQVVCLALDPVYDSNGYRREEASHMWVDNSYILQLREDLGGKALFGASVHPYDPLFERRTREAVLNDAVLMKWIPSAQQIDLADPRVRSALEFLSSAKNGKPLPLLLHAGPEYAIPTSDDRTHTWDFLRWTRTDQFRNWLRGKKKRNVPDVNGTRRNLEAGLDAGAHIIFAHCGLPYFASGWFGRLFEHDDFPVVQQFLSRPLKTARSGKCFADVSALCTPFRKRYFDEIRKLPADRLLFGSDFPTPAFELDADSEEHMKDFRAVLDGEVERICVPQDNLLDVNYRVLRHAFPGHPMFENFQSLL